MTRRYGRTVVACTALAALALTACSPSEDPAKVCAAPETQQQVRLLLGRTANDLAVKFKDQLPAAGIDFADPQHTQGVKLDLITLSSADKTTHKITCATRASTQISPAVAAKIKEAAGSFGEAAALMAGGQVQLTYSRQPQANGQGFVYSLDNADNVGVLAIALVTQTVIEKALATANIARLAEAAKAAAQPGTTETVGSDATGAAASSEPAQ